MVTLLTWLSRLNARRAETSGGNHAQGPPTNLHSVCRLSATGSTGRFGERSTDTESKQDLCTRNQGLSYSWHSLKWNPRNVSQRNARLITSTAWGHMWSMRLRVNYARQLILDPLCVLCMREQRNTLPRQRTRPKPQPWGRTIRPATRNPSQKCASGLSAPPRELSCDWGSRRRK